MPSRSTASMIAFRIPLSSGRATQNFGSFFAEHCIWRYPEYSADLSNAVQSRGFISLFPTNNDWGGRFEQFRKMPLAPTVALAEQSQVRCKGGSKFFWLHRLLSLMLSFVRSAAKGFT